MSDEQRQAFEDLHIAWDGFVIEVAKAWRIPQLCDWLNKVIERYHV